MYTSGPFWGRIVDSRRPRIVLLFSFALLLGGYSGIKHFYDSGLPAGTSTLPAFGFYLLVLCNFLTGSGSVGGITSSLNSTVKSFPDRVVGDQDPVLYRHPNHPLVLASIRNWSGSCGFRTIGILFHHSF